MRMAKYIAKRLLVSILTLWVMFTITFFLMHLVPGNPFLSDKPLPKQVLENLIKKYQLDKPLIVQYIKYTENVVLHFDLGDSIRLTGRTVNRIIADGFPYSMRLGLVAISISLFFGT